MSKLQEPVKKMSSEEYRKRLSHITPVLSERILERFAEPDAINKFAAALEKHPRSMGLSVIIEEANANEDVSEELYNHFRTELRKFEAAFLRTHGVVISHEVFLLLSSDATLELLDEKDYGPKHNVKMLEDFGVSTEFPALKYA